MITKNRLGVTATSQELAPPEPRTREPDTHDPRERTVVSTPHTLTHDHTEDTTGTQTLDTRQRVTGGVSTIFHSIQYTRTK
jgi:hypothetical protein